MRGEFRIYIVLALLNFSQVNSFSQENSEPEIIFTFFNNLYSFQFQEAKDNLAIINSINISPDLLDICTANYHWWLIATQEEHENSKVEMLSSLDRIIIRYKDTKDIDLNEDALFALIHAYAYKTRLHIHEGNYLKGAGNLNLTVKFLELILPRAEENLKFMLLAGLYHYVAGTFLDTYPVFHPLFILAPKADVDKGLKLLLECSESDHPMIRTEALYFLMIAQNQLGENPVMADSYAKQLLKEYPGNKYYRSYRITLLADAGSLIEARKEYYRLCSLEPGDQLSPAQHNYLIEKTNKHLRKKRIKF